MKGLALLIAAAVATTGVAATPAAAQERVRVVERHHYESSDRRWDRGRHHGWRNDRWRWRTKCWTQWRNGRREKVCRRIRYR